MLVTVWPTHSHFEFSIFVFIKDCFALAFSCLFDITTGNMLSQDWYQAPVLKYLDGFVIAPIVLVTDFNVKELFTKCCMKGFYSWNIWASTTFYVRISKLFSDSLGLYHPPLLLSYFQDLIFWQLRDNCVLYFHSLNILSFSLMIHNTCVQFN